MGTKIPAGVKSLRGAFLAVVDADWTVSLFTLGIAGMTMLIIIGSSRISPTFPASLVAVIVVSLIAYIGDFNVPTIGTLPDSLPAPRLPLVRLDLLIELAPAACAVALWLPSNHYFRRVWLLECQVKVLMLLTANWW